MNMASSANSLREYVFFNTAGTYHISAAALSSTKFVVVDSDKGNSDYGTAIIGDVSGKTITYGPERVFNTAVTFEISVAALSSTKFVVVYGDGGNSHYSTAIIGDVSGNTIIYGSEYMFKSVHTLNLSVAALSSTKFVAAYLDEENDDCGTTIIGDVTGNTITFGLEYVFNTDGSYNISVDALSETRFVVVVHKVLGGQE